MSSLPSDFSSITPPNINVRVSPRAKRMGLRVDSKKGGFILTLPPKAMASDINRFLKDAAPWMAKQDATAKQNCIFEPGFLVPFQGYETELVHLEQSGPRSVIFINGEIQVRGPLKKFHDQVLMFLKHQAQGVFLEICIELAAQLPRKLLKKPIPLQKISIKDTKTRWGSCSSSGTISLCWRLIL